jgi:hypothetical protein
MDIISYLPVSMPHIEKLTDFLVVLLPIFPLTSLGTIQGGLASSAVLELEIRRCYGATNYAALGHDCCLSGVRVLVVSSGCRNTRAKVHPSIGTSAR